MLSRRRCENCDVHVLVTLEAAADATAGGAAAGWTTTGGGGLVGSLIMFSLCGYAVNYNMASFGFNLVIC